MGERRQARRYELYLPVQVCLSSPRPVEFSTGQLRDVSRSGVFFHSQVPIASGAGLELTFSLPAEKERGTSVLVRASAKALRVSTLVGDDTPLYGVAATIDRIDFIRPVISSAA
jgi:PilZ domain